ncbi:hypothetical protein EG329_001506 [Mollisiaceae sp. DMI_Dod_QoI]|nr:hypothetical protein EG329_001506 [Helotiales sp. DMI_Dod_QoI]
MSPDRTFETGIRTAARMDDTEHVVKKRRIDEDSDIEEDALSIPESEHQTSREMLESNDEAMDDWESGMGDETHAASSDGSQSPSKTIPAEYDFDDEMPMSVAMSVEDNSSDDGMPVRLSKKRKLAAMSVEYDSSDSPDDVTPIRSSNTRKFVAETESEDEDEQPGEAGASTSSQPDQTDRKESLRLKQHRMVIKALKYRLIFAKPSLNQSDLQECLEMIEVLEEKYRTAAETKIKVRTLQEPHPKTVQQHKARLEGEEENQRAWLHPRNSKSVMPELVMRAWDEMSECQIKDFRVGFLSGGSTCRLDTHERRQLWLKRHANWGNRFKTPFISTSTSLKEIGTIRVPHFQERQKRKGIRENTKLTLININARLAEGKPVLRMMDELIHYQVTTRQGEPAYKEGTLMSTFYLSQFHQMKSLVRGPGTKLKGGSTRTTLASKAGTARLDFQHSRSMTE